MDEPIVILCPGCGIEHRLPPTSAGRSIGCPACGADINVPGEDPHAKPKEPEQPDEWYFPPPDDAERGREPGGENPDLELLRRKKARTLVFGPGDFFRLLNRAYLYPVSSGSGVVFLVMMSLAWSALRIGYGAAADPLTLVAMGLFNLIVLGYAFSYFWKIVRETGVGNLKAPGPADTAMPLETFGDFFRFFFAAISAWVPMIILVLYVVFSDPGFSRTGAFMPILIGCIAFQALYHPMALALVGFYNRFFVAFNYTFGIRSALRIPKQYLVCVVYFFATGMGFAALETYVFGRLSDNLAQKAIAFLALTLVQLYLYALQMHVVGLLYLCNKKRIGFFE